MTREKFSVLVKSMKAVYTSDKFIDDKDSFDVWYAVIGDLPYAEASAGVAAYIKSDTKGFPPVPGQIIEYTEKEKKRNYWAQMEAKILGKDRQCVITDSLKC